MVLPFRSISVAKRPPASQVYDSELPSGRVIFVIRLWPSRLKVVVFCRSSKLSSKVTRAGKFEVRMRNGFFGVTDEEAHATARTPQEQLVEALTSPFHTTGVHLQLTSVFANSLQQGSFLPTMLHIDANDLTFTVEPDGSHKSTFNVVVFTFGAEAGVVDQTGRTYTIRIPRQIMIEL